MIHGDATQFDKLLAERGIPQVDHVLSGLPLPSFPEALRNAVLETSARTLAPHGTFRQLTVMPLIYYKMYARYFDDRALPVRTLEPAARRRVRLPRVQGRSRYH